MGMFFYIDMFCKFFYTNYKAVTGKWIWSAAAEHSLCMKTGADRQQMFCGKSRLLS